MADPEPAKEKGKARRAISQIASRTFVAPTAKLLADAIREGISWLLS